MGDILKEAIADAKAVRETALQNAKMALEEAFTPQIKSMLSAKLKEDEFGDDEEEFGGEEEMPDEEVPEEGYYEDEEFGGEEEMPADEEIPEIPAEEADEFGGDMGDEMGDEEDELDLEAIIRELESELQEQDDAYDESDPGEKAEHMGGTIGEGEDNEDEDDVEIDESLFTEEEDEDEDDEKVDEQSDSSDIGKGDNQVDVADASDEEDPEGGAGTKVQAMESLQSQLSEYKEAVVFLKNKLHEVNILNAKLLFTNKLFKEFSLNNNQKLKVVETFDRTQSTREIKLVYSTLAEQFGDNGSISRKKSIKESASSKSGSTKPSKESRKVISEEAQVANRFKKLAGIL